MSDEEQIKFQEIIEGHKVLFDGELDLYSHTKNHLKVKEDAVPVYKKPYPVPHKRYDVFR